MVRLVYNDDTGQNSVASEAYGWLGTKRQTSLHQCRSCEMAFFWSGDFFFGIPDVDSDASLSLLFLSLSLLLMCGALITPRFHAASLLSLAVSFSSRRSLVNRNFPQVISG